MAQRVSDLLPGREVPQADRRSALAERDGSVRRERDVEHLVRVSLELRASGRVDVPEQHFAITAAGSPESRPRAFCRPD